VLAFRVPGRVGGDCDLLRGAPGEFTRDSPRDSTAMTLASACSSLLRMDCLAVSRSSCADAVWLGAIGGGIGAASDRDMRSSTIRWPRGECGGCFTGEWFAATGVERGVGLSLLWSKAVLCKELIGASVRCPGAGRPPSVTSSCLTAGVSTSMSCDFESTSFPLTVDRPGVSPLGSVRTRLTTSGRGILLRELEEGIRAYLD